MPAATTGTGTLTTWCTTAMAGPVTVTLPARPSQALPAPVGEAFGVFHRVQEACSRFDSSSPLMAANAEPCRWHRLPSECFEALRQAHLAHLATDGMFDPRVHDDLVAMGYDRSFTRMEAGEERVPPATKPCSPAGGGPGAAPRARPWEPRFRRVGRSANLGGARVDLGGIGKGLAVRWASQRLRRYGPDFLVDAGGDCYAAGIPGDGGLWRIGVESPVGEDGHVAVLEVSDMACATSSTRVRRWNNAGRPMHHLVDPRTGAPGGDGLVSVTVVGTDPAWAEVWSKTLFLAGLSGIAAAAEERDLAALWVSEDGEIGTSTPVRPCVIWTRP